MYQTEKCPGIWNSRSKLNLSCKCRDRVQFIFDRYKYTLRGKVLRYTFESGHVVCYASNTNARMTSSGNHGITAKHARKQNPVSVSIHCIRLERNVISIRNTNSQLSIFCPEYHSFLRIVRLSINVYFTQSTKCKFSSNSIERGHNLIVRENKGSLKCTDMIVIEKLL